MSLPFLEHVGPIEGHIRKPFRAGNHEVSVQASAFHYSSPRQDGLPLEQYTRFEVACWPTGQELHWATPRNLPALEPFAEYWGGDDVAGYVPAEVVQEIVYALCDAGRHE